MPDASPDVSIGAAAPRILARAGTPPIPRATPEPASGRGATGPWQAIDRLMAVNDAQAARLGALERSIESLTARLTDQAGIIAQLSRDKAEAAEEARRAHARLDAATAHMVSGLVIDAKGDLVAMTADGGQRTIGRVTGRDGRDAVNVADGRIADGRLVLTMTDGRVLDCGQVCPPAPASEAPPAPAHIADMLIDAAGELVAVLSDSSTRKLGRVIGEDGRHGAAIETAAINDAGRLVLALTDGRRIDAGLVREPARATDTPAAPVLASVLVDGDGDLVLVMSDASTRKAGRVKGEAGINGATIADAVINDVGRLVLTMTDGRRIDAGYARQPQAPSQPAARANRAKARAALDAVHPAARTATASAAEPLPWVRAGISRSTWYRRRAADPARRAAVGAQQESLHRTT